jgi:hypothetical protein
MQVLASGLRTGLPFAQALESAAATRPGRGWRPDELCLDRGAVWVNA